MFALEVGDLVSEKLVTEFELVYSIEKIGVGLGWLLFEIERNEVLLTFVCLD